MGFGLGPFSTAAVLTGNPLTYIRRRDVIEQVLHTSKGEVLQTSGGTVTNQGRTVTMQLRAKCD